VLKFVAWAFFRAFFPLLPARARFYAGNRRRSRPLSIPTTA